MSIKNKSHPEAEKRERPSQESNSNLKRTVSGSLHHHYIRIPRWPVLVAFIIIGILYSILTEELTIGPGWILLIGVLLLILLAILSVLSQNHKLARYISLFTTGMVTISLLISVILLINSLLSHSILPTALIRDALVLWTANVLTYGIWFWQLDRGGPAYRHSENPGEAELLFPQMTQTSLTAKAWIPGFLDYLFVAFNTSTAFSPTDTPVLSRRLKALTMLQSSNSLVIIAVLAARAINIL